MTTLPTTKRTTTRSTTTTTTRSWLSSLSSTQWFNQPTDQNPIGWSSWGQWSDCRLIDPRKCSGTRIRTRKCSGRCSTGSTRDHGICQVTDTNVCVREDPCYQAQSDPYFCYYNRFSPCCRRPSYFYYNYGK